MRSSAARLSLILSLLSSTLAPNAVGAEPAVSVCFHHDGKLFVAARPLQPGDSDLETALDALVAGPTTTESATGMTTAIPAETRVLSIVIGDDAVEVDLSAPRLREGLDEALLQAVFEQFRWTVELAGYGPSTRLTIDGTPLPDYLPPRAPVGTRPKALPQAPAGPMPLGSALAGREISLSPGHGYRWGGSSWVYDRPVYCAPLSREDDHNVDLCIYLATYLEQDGAVVPKYRCLNKNQGNDPYTGSPWWTMSGSYWLKQIGYPCSVYAGSSGDCVLGSGDSESSDCIVSRPIAANYDNTDLHISMHTNGLAGDCTGDCPNGTVTYYDGSDGTWGPPSQAFAQSVQNSIISFIRNRYPDPGWRDRGLGSANFAETRIPNRPSILIELAFHDTCDYDALYLRDNFFRSGTMWGVYEGCCNYFGVTPTYGFYSDEFVSDTIPPTMEPGQSYNVSLTFRNRGVLWNNTHGFKLGAVGDSDPFAATRHSISGEVNPADTYTFNFTMTAPTTPGLYTTDWRMLREGVTWFGATHSEVVTVGAGPFPPSITQHPSSDNVIIGSNASFTVQAAGTEPLSYQWQYFGTDLSDDSHIIGAQTATLQIVSVTGADTGDYRCVVTNTVGSDTSDPATLTVQVDPVVFIVESRSGGLNYDRFSSDGTWADSGGKSTASGTTPGVGSIWTSTTYAGRSATYAFTPDFTGTYEVSATWPTSTNACPSAEHIISYAGNSTTRFMDQLNNANAWNSLGEYTLNAGTEYTVVQRTDGSTGGGVLRADAIRWQMTGIPVQPPVVTQHPSADLVCPGTTVVLEVTAGGQGPLSDQWQKNQVDIANGGHYAGVTTPTLTITNADASDAGNYRCVVSNIGGETPSSSAALSFKTATAITYDPSPQEVNQGESVSFTVQADGEGNLTYKWQKDSTDVTDGGRISGATTQTLHIVDSQTSDSGEYRCLVTAECGSATSAEATLTVLGPPPIPGDFDDDRDVDQEDFSHFQLCLGLYDVPTTHPECVGAILDGDNDVNQDDFAVFQRCMTGADVPGDPACAGS